MIEPLRIFETALMASAVVIADLHGFSYGRENNRLLQQIRSINPHVILIAGDMLVSKYEKPSSGPPRRSLIYEGSIGTILPFS